MAPGCLGSYATTLLTLAIPKPAGVPHAHAAALPTTTTTAQLVLLHAAHTLRHSCVLVHAAGGGVGLAASSLAHAVGAHTCGTAGSSVKRHLLRSHMHMHRVSTSRHLHFAQDLATQHMQPTLVLNVLTSTGMIAASLAAMAPAACFVEISKRDIWSAPLLMSNRHDVSYSVVALDFLAPNQASQALHHLACSLHQGALTFMPAVSHTIGDTSKALRQMTQAKHVGKLVVR
eukprot:1102081-Prorocentrum_minimum.AAC.1